MSRLFRLRKNEKGQALVEFALIAIIIVAITLAVAQFGMILSAQIAVTNAAREGARVASVGKSIPDITTRVRDSVSGHKFLNTTSMTVTGNTVGQPVKVIINGARVITIIPIPSPVLGEANVVNSGVNFPINGEASMRMEIKR